MGYMIVSNLFAWINKMHTVLYTFYSVTYYYVGNCLWLMLLDLFLFDLILLIKSDI